MIDITCGYGHKCVAGNEAIATQFNDSVVKDLEGVFTDLLNYTREYNIKSTKDLMKRAGAKVLLKKCDEILTERFGMPFKHIGAGGGMYGIFTVSGRTNDVLDPYKEEVINNTEKYVNYCKSSGECGSIKPKDDLSFIDNDYLTVLDQVVKASTEIQRQIGKEGIIIDEQNAKVMNFPKGFNVHIVADIKKMFTGYGVTPLELVATLLHEIGHQFTHLKNSYRRLATVTVLLETVRNEFSENKDKRDALVLVIKKTSGKDMSKSSDIELLTESTTALVSYLTEDDNYSATDSEQQADQFAARFGLGAEVVSALDKMHRKNIELHGTPFRNVMTSTLTFSVITGLYFLIIGSGLMLTMTVTVAMFFVSMISYALGMLIVGYETNRNIYDDDITRFRRIKLDIIRQIRECDFDKVMTKKFLKDLDKLESILNRTADSVSVISRLGDTLPWNSASFRAARLSKELEVLSENDLHLAKARLQTYLGEK